MNISINALITNEWLIMIMFVYVSACLGNACVVNVLTAIVKRIELNVNALYKCYPLLLLLLLYIA